MEGDFLGEEAGTDAADGSCGTDDGGAIFWAKRGGGIEGEGGLAAFELDQGLGEKRRAGALIGGVGGGGKHLECWAVAKEVGGEVEPMDGEIGEDELREGFEWGATNPVMIPMNGEIDRGNFADDLGVDGGADVGLVG